MSDTYRERELTFDVPDGWSAPEASRFVPADGTLETGTQHLESTYYDTAGQELFGSLLTLRRRTGDADQGWQLKVPAGDARQEVRLPITPGRGVPAELRLLTAGVRGRAALRAIATLRTEREVQRVVGADGVGLVEIVLDTVTATVKREFSVVRTWREVEVELLPGGEEKLLARIAKWLGRSGATPAVNVSKLGRALESSARPARSPDTAAGVIGTYLDPLFAAIVAGDVTLRREASTQDTHEAIHATRVATRRYRSTLRIFGELLDRERAETLAGELAWFGAALGGVRDRQVLRRHLLDALDRLDPALVIGPVRRRVDRALAAEEDEARAALDEVMTSPRHAALLAELRAWSAALPSSGDAAAHVLVRHAERADRTLAKRLVAADRAEDPDVGHHRARKAAKRARYAAELVGPVGGKGAERQVRRAKKVQKRLGRRQDDVVAAEFLLRLGRLPGGNNFALGVLYRIQRELADATH